MKHVSVFDYEAAYAQAMMKLAQDEERVAGKRIPISTKNQGKLKADAAIRRPKMLAYIRKNPGTQPADLRKKFNITVNQCTADVKALQRHGVISDGKRPPSYRVIG